MAETLDEADPGRPHPSDMRVDPRNFLSPFLLNAEKKQERGGSRGTSTLRMGELLGLGSSSPIDVLRLISRSAVRGATTGPPGRFSNKIYPQRIYFKIKSDIQRGGGWTKFRSRLILPSLKAL
jgi:hypothetical protein